MNQLDPRMQRRIQAMNDVFGLSQEDVAAGLSPMDIASLLGRSVDSITGAPTRAGVGAMITGEDPLAAAAKQFGGNPESAPSFGFIEDMVLDPTNLIGFGGKNIPTRLAALGEVGAIGKDISGINKAKEVSPLGFHSKLYDIIQEKMGGSASPEQILAIASQAKKEEIANSGIEKLVSGKNKLTREEVLAHIKSNTPELSESIRIDNPKYIPGLEDPAGIARRKEIFKEYQPKINEAEAHDDLRFAEKLRDERDALADKAYRLKADQIKPTKYGKYTLPGGADDSYREVLLKLGERRNPMSFEDYAAEYRKNAPGIDDATIRERYPDYVKDPGNDIAKDNFNSQHFDEPNILAHARVNDRVTPDGKTLFIEELQSDWHQQGRNRGYKGPKDLEMELRFKELNRKRTEGIDVTANLYNEMMARAQGVLKPLSHQEKVALPNIIARQGPGSPAPEIQSAIEKIGKEQYENLFNDKEFIEKLSNYRKHYDEHGKVINEFHDVQEKLRQNQDAVPDAPFKKNWHELMMKRLMRQAAEGGYDNIGWTTGAQQAKRYDLSKHIEDVRLIKRQGTRDRLIAYDKGGYVVMDKELGEGQPDVADYIGKELAARLEAQPSQGHPMYGDAPTDKFSEKSLSGADLEVGGEGMKGFYDKIISDFMNNFGKKYGTKVGKSSIQNGMEVNSMKITPQMRDDILKNGLPLYALPPAVLLKLKALEQQNGD